MNKIIYDMPETEYHGSPFGMTCLSSSVAHTLVSRSPAHAYAEHPCLGGGPREFTDAMLEGSIIDSLILSNGANIVALEYDSYRTKDAREDRDAALLKRKLPVLVHKLEDYKIVAHKIRKQLTQFINWKSAEAQVSAFWVERADDGTEVQCKARFDLLDYNTIYDLKKVQNANPAALPKHIVNYGYDIQAIAYLRALQAVRPDFNGHGNFTWIFAELDLPVAIRAVPSGMMLKRGILMWRMAINSWAKCIKEKNWPCYEDMVRVELPKYLLDEVVDGEPNE